MIRFAGVDLLLEDQAGRVSAWLDRYSPLEDLRLFGSHFPSRSPLWQARGASCRHLGVPLINWPSPPRMRLNSLYWPTGATRWACGLFLTDDEGLESVLKKVQGDGGAEYNPHNLILCESTSDLTLDNETAGGFYTDGDGHAALVTQMHLLNPRPISGVDEQRLWLLPLVDERYFWQWAEGFVDLTDTWADVVTGLGEMLGVTSLSVTAGDAWGTPDQTEVRRDWQNAAVMLDAVAASVGQRVVRDCGTGTVSLQAWGAGFTLASDAVSETDSGRLAGGYMYEATAPSVATAVNVVFRSTIGPVNVVQKFASDYSVTKTNGRTRTFHVPSIDDFAGDTPTAASDDLADAIATAYYGFSRLEYDVSYPGIRRWPGSSFDDFVMFSMGCRREDGSFQAATRGCSLPPNVGVDVLLNRADEEQNEDDCENFPNLWGCADDDWDAYGTVTVSIYDEDGDTGLNVTAKAPGIDGLQNTRGILLPISGQTPTYKFLPDECEPTCGVSA